MSEYPAGMSATAVIEWHKNMIRELLRRVPARVNAGSHDITVAYKDAVTFANKQLASGRATLMNLKQAAQRLQAYE